MGDEIKDDRRERLDRATDTLSEARWTIDYMLNHPVLGKMFVMPDPPPPPLPWEVQEVDEEQ